VSNHSSDDALIARERNLARYFTETRHVSWVLLIATLAWGVFAYVTMSKAKDPLVPVRIAVATCAWPGASADKVEQLVTRKIEERMAENSKVEKIESISRAGVAVVYVTLAESVIDRAKELDDISGKLNTIRDLPPGAAPIDFIKDFGETAALMLTVASPKVSDIELELRARALQPEREALRVEALLGVRSVAAPQVLIEHGLQLLGAGERDQLARILEPDPIDQTRECTGGQLAHRRHQLRSIQDVTEQLTGRGRDIALQVGHGASLTEGCILRSSRLIS
jgi:hypothetical protein